MAMLVRYSIGNEGGLGLDDEQIPKRVAALSKSSGPLKCTFRDSKDMLWV